jgi:hypothetical protein
MSDPRRPAIRDAIANGVDPLRLPGLEATVDRVLEAIAEPELDPRHAEPVGMNEVAGLTVAFKALVLRAGGRVEFTNPELEHAATLHARVDADPERMVVELVDGPPPDVPRFASEGA